jgi:hypothetical protein
MEQKKKYVGRGIRGNFLSGTESENQKWNFHVQADMQIQTGEQRE